MPDIVVTVPLNFSLPAFPNLRGLDTWCEEGDAAGEPESGKPWVFTTGGSCPSIEPGERVYVVCEDRLRGYAPLVWMEYRKGVVALVRKGGAVAVTIPSKIVGFRGWRERWWSYSEEVPFPNWRTVDRRHSPPVRSAGHPAMVTKSQRSLF